MKIRVYGFVPAKSTSERIKNKNISVLDGDKLYVKALKILMQCKEIDAVFLDSDCSKMYENIDYLPIRFMKRDRALANNETDGHQLFLNEIKSFPDADIYVQLLCTSPFIKPSTIDNAIIKIKQGLFDSAIMMKREKMYLWENNHPIYNINHIPNSKDLPDVMAESMGLYISTKESAISTKRRYGNNILYVYGDLEELIDINNQDDLLFARIYASGLKRLENQKLTLLKHLVSSPILSDCLDDLKIESKGKVEYGNVINGWLSNMEATKIFGRASTLRLRALKAGEDFTGIYNALNSYEQISDNSVIVVENELKQYAYFGDLNARMAIRSGACAAIIDGASRDLEATRTLRFPVFCREYNAMDVRRRATLDYINKPVKIGNAIVNPGDLIFMDECAMVVIYKQTEEIVFNRIFNILQNEKNIAQDIFQNKDIKEILQTRGNF